MNKWASKAIYASQCRFKTWWIQSSLTNHLPPVRSHITEKSLHNVAFTRRLPSGLWRLWAGSWVNTAYTEKPLWALGVLSSSSGFWTWFAAGAKSLRSTPLFSAIELLTKRKPSSVAVSRGLPVVEKFYFVYSECLHLIYWRVGMSPQKAIQKTWFWRKTGFGLGREAVQGSQGVALQCYPSGQDWFPGGCYPQLPSVLAFQGPWEGPRAPVSQISPAIPDLNSASFTEVFGPCWDAKAQRGTTLERSLSLSLTFATNNPMNTSLYISGPRFLYL